MQLKYFTVVLAVFWNCLSKIVGGTFAKTSDLLLNRHRAIVDTLAGQMQFFDAKIEKMTQKINDADAVKSALDEQIESNSEKARQLMDIIETAIQNQVLRRNPETYKDSIRNFWESSLLIYDLRIKNAVMKKRLESLKAVYEHDEVSLNRYDSTAIENLRQTVFYLEGKQNEKKAYLAETNGKIQQTLDGFAEDFVVLKSLHPQPNESDTDTALMNWDLLHNSYNKTVANIRNRLLAIEQTQMTAERIENEMQDVTTKLEYCTILVGILANSQELKTLPSKNELYFALLNKQYANSYQHLQHAVFEQAMIYQEMNQLQEKRTRLENKIGFIKMELENLKEGKNVASKSLERIRKTFEPALITLENKLNSQIYQTSSLMVALEKPEVESSEENQATEVDNNQNGKTLKSPDINVALKRMRQGVESRISQLITEINETNAAFNSNRSPIDNHQEKQKNSDSLNTWKQSISNELLEKDYAHEPVRLTLNPVIINPKQEEAGKLNDKTVSKNSIGSLKPNTDNMSPFSINVPSKKPKATAITLGIVAVGLGAALIVGGYLWLCK